MVMQDGLVRIFWPLEYIKPESSGILIGWRNSDSDVLVASILQNAVLRSVQEALPRSVLFKNSPYSMNHILHRCGPAKLEVLGIVNPKSAFTPCQDLPISAITTANSLLPNIVGPEDDTSNNQVILYARPHPDQLQYLSLEPISLRLEDVDGRAAHDTPLLEDVDAADKEDGGKDAELVQKLKLHTVKRFPPTEKELKIALVISQINCSLDIDAVLQRNIGMVRPRSKRAMSVSERVVESATNLWDYVQIFLWHIWSIWIYPVLRQSFILVLMAHRIAGESILLLARQPIGPQKTTLKDLSATAQQVDLRLQQFYYWPVQYLTLRDRKDNWQCISNNHAEYIRFYNSLWLVVNDAIMGIAFGAYVVDNAPFVAAQVTTLLGTWSLEGLRHIISWLMVYPGGLKLNNELARFLGDLFIWVIDYWGGCVAAFQPHLPGLIRLIGIASFAGATMPLSIASDLLSLCTVHIYCFYVASARIYGWQLTIISSLFHLFRGKKRNVLRNRIDSCDYELDQLLLGTILFTLLTFLLPTVMVFYLTFTVARMAIIGLKAALDLMLAFLNHFPLFALMLRIKDPWRLPGGIRFELQDTPIGSSHSPTSLSGSTSYITLKSIPLALPAILHEYYQLGSRIRKHYFSSSVFLCLSTGGIVPLLPRRNLYSLQYSMLPAVRVSIGELWKRLTGAMPTSPTVKTPRMAEFPPPGKDRLQRPRSSSMKNLSMNGSTKDIHKP